MPLREYPLNGVPCVECGRPGLAFVPPIGVKHQTGWCRTGDGEMSTAPVIPLISAAPERRCAA